MLDISSTLLRLAESSPCLDKALISDLKKEMASLGYSIDEYDSIDISIAAEQLCTLMLWEYIMLAVEDGYGSSIFEEALSQTNSGDIGA